MYINLVLMQFQTTLRTCRRTWPRRPTRWRHARRWTLLRRARSWLQRARPRPVNLANCTYRSSCEYHHRLQEQMGDWCGSDKQTWLVYTTGVFILYLFFVAVHRLKCRKEANGEHSEYADDGCVTPRTSILALAVVLCTCLHLITCEYVV